MIYTIVVLAIAAYLLGSIPSAVWIGKHFYGIDIREHGSKNAGTTNMLRVLGRRAALPVFAIDFLKGFVAVRLSNFMEYLPEFSPGGVYAQNGLDALRVGLVVAVVLGHIFPVFAGFKGGKGVATLAGAVMGVAPSAVLLCLVVWGAVLMRTHFVSLASIVAGCAFPIFILISRQTQHSVVLIVFSCLVAVLLLVTHRKNIGRLRAGTESKIYIWRKPHRRTPPERDPVNEGDGSGDNTDNENPK